MSLEKDSYNVSFGSNPMVSKGLHLLRHRWCYYPYPWSLSLSISLFARAPSVLSFFLGLTLRCTLYNVPVRYFVRFRALFILFTRIHPEDTLGGALSQIHSHTQASSLCSRRFASFIFFPISDCRGPLAYFHFQSVSLGWCNCENVRSVSVVKALIISIYILFFVSHFA